MSEFSRPNLSLSTENSLHLFIPFEEGFHQALNDNFIVEIQRFGGEPCWVRTSDLLIKRKYITLFLRISALFAIPLNILKVGCFLKDFAT